MTLIGTSPAVCELRQQAKLAARSDVRLLLTGERGVGKEFLARIVHHDSRHRTAPFVSLDCGVLANTPDQSCGDMQEDDPIAVALAQADGGTIFLKSIHELTLQLQDRLMRFLEAAEFLPPGVRSSHRVDTRIISSTSVPLTGSIEGGLFREDLYYRLNVVDLRIPPLRERRSDVQPLFEHFTTQPARRLRPRPALSREWRTAFDSYDWPENVSELKATAERLVAEGLA